MISPILDNDADDSIVPIIEPPTIDKDKLKTLLSKLNSRQTELKSRSESDRKLRKLPFNPLKYSGQQKLQQSEYDIAEEMSRTNTTNRLIPYRMIHAFIAREKPIFLQYLTSPTRIAIFTDETTPTINLSPLEDFHTKCFRYNGSVSRFMRAVDISQLHGYAIMEVLFDPSMPGHFRFIAHRYEDIVFPDCDEMATCYSLYIRKRYQCVDLKKLNIEPDKKQRLLDIIENEDKETYINTVYVNTPNGYYTISYSEELKDFVDDFKIFYNGFPQSERILNLFTLVYDQNNETHLNDKRGRAFYDRDIQRCATVLISALAEKAFKSSSVYGGLEQGKSLSGEAKALELQLLPDTILNVPITFFSPPEPTTSMLGMVNQLETMHANNAGQTNFAANNRQDSRKTATELNAAQQMASMMSSIPLGEFSSFISKLIDYSWLILSWSAANGLIELPSLLQPDDFKKKYFMKPAGDTDYVKRQEKLMQMLAMLPMIANSPLGNIFISRIVDLAFPDEKFSLQLDQQSKQLELFNALLQICKQFLASPNATTGIPPEQLAQIQSIVAASEQDVADNTAQLAQSSGNTNVPQDVNQQTGLPPSDSGMSTGIPA